MSTIELGVYGHSYTGGPAGSSSAVFQASMSGSQSDRIYYKVHDGSLGDALRDKVLGDRVYAAYLNADARSTLDSLAVIYRTPEDVDAAAMSAYCLFPKLQSR